MIEKALKYLANLNISPSERIITEVDSNNEERTFIIDDRGVGREVEARSSLSDDVLHVRTLTSLIDYIKSEEFRPINKQYLHVVSERKVSLISELDSTGVREQLITTDAIVPTFEYEYFHDAEELIIALQSKFTKTGDCDVLLKVIGNVKEDNVRTTGDTGISQAVTIQTGITSVGDVKVPNPVTLAPYRTFLEVEQPSSEFIFRMKDGPKGAIFEADGGAWRNEAIANVRDYLAEELKDEIESGRITIIA